MRSRRWKILKRAVAISIVVTAFGFSKSALAVDSFTDHEMKLSADQRSIQGLESEIHELIEQKRHMDDQAAVKQVMDTLAAKHKELEKIVTEYEELRLHVRFKHPDLNDKAERKYVRYQLRSLKEMEEESGLDGRLDRAKIRVFAIFPTPEMEKKASGVKPNTELKINAAFRKPANLDAEEQIRLVK